MPVLERVLDQYMPVEPRDVEAAFDRIWQDASGGVHDTSSVRLRISNIIVWGEGREVGDRFDGVMDTIARRHPCRAILAVTSPDVGTLESSISARCWRTAMGSRHICLEEILLRGRPDGEHELASAVLGLTVSELPVHLWLVGEPNLARLPIELWNLADRVYIDTAAAADARQALRALANDVRMEAVVVDLAWERARAWRELSAQFFDTSAAAAQLERLTTVQIAGGTGRISSAALSLAGWLSAALQLSLASTSVENTLIKATFYDGTRAVELQLEPSPEGMELERLTLRTGQATFSIEMHAASGHLYVSSDLTSESMQRAVARDPDDDASLLIAAIEDTSAPDVYISALRDALGLLDV
jgi:glucose-6-phosphate dehydrogenase assembly protein OpcA